jgi:pimeloyl-ACP methyl ester carboxylesterase
VALTHRFVDANGLRHHVVEQGSGPLVLLLHGWPEGWYSWRHQLEALARAGFRAVAPDVRGYGRTDAPAEVHGYRIRDLVADAAGLVEALGEKTAVVVGHDWGAVIAWHCALLRPDVFRAVAALSIPLPVRSPVPPMAVFRKRFEGQFFYMLYFQEPGVAEAELEADVRRSLRLVYYAASGDARPGPGFFGKPAGARLLDGMVDPPVLPDWLTEQDLDVYAADFARAGFRGGLNKYRAMDLDWHDLESLAGAKVEIPALFVAGERDMAIMRPTAIEDMAKRVPQMRAAIVLPGKGHWVQQEASAEVSDALTKFLAGL